MRLSSREAEGRPHIVPAEKPLRAWAAANGRPPEESWPGLCGSPKATAAMLASVQAACKASKLIAFEIPVAVALVDDPWTPENDCTAAAMKLKRQVITKKHAAQLQAIYK
jgi:long-chain acyl-CoA synthetase